MVFVVLEFLHHVEILGHSALFLGWKLFTSLQTLRIIVRPKYLFNLFKWYVSESIIVETFHFENYVLMYLVNVLVMMIRFFFVMIVTLFMVLNKLLTTIFHRIYFD